MITSVQIAWVAGILEGEGCFTYNHTPQITLRMTDLDTVIRTRDLINPRVNIYITPPSPESNQKERYSFTANSSKAAEWMMTIYPLMGTRRKTKIREVLDIWRCRETIRPKTDGFCYNGHRLYVYGKDFTLRSNGSIVCKACARDGAARARSRQKESKVCQS